MGKKKDQYAYGRAKAHKVARSLRRKGARVEISEGSKGAADLIAKFSTGTKWAVQVKSTRSGIAHDPIPRDIGRLKRSATISGSTAVVAKVGPEGVEYSSARTGRKLSPPSSRKRK